MKAAPEYIMLVRNPYNRVASFFKEKLRQKVKMAGEDLYTLKRHQEIFYPYINLKKNDSTELKVARLLEFTFKDFVQRIPEVYPFEDHLAPQTLNFSWPGIAKFMRMNRYIHIENAEEMNWLADYFELDLSIKANDSSIGQMDEIRWDEGSISIVKRIYRKDFERFGYDFRFPE